MHQMKQKETSADPNWEANHPDWNKVVLVPINVSTTTSSSNSTVATAFDHYLNIASTRLVGGSQNPLDPVKIVIVYGKFDQ
jgi:hypothetical protein